MSELYKIAKRGRELIRDGYARNWRKLEEDARERLAVTIDRLNARVQKLKDEGRIE